MKFTPHIIIWELDLKIDDTVIDSYYFLTRRGAEKFWEKNKENWKDYQVVLGGEPLWLW